MSIEDFEHEVLWQPWGRHDGLKKLLDEVYEEVLPYSDKTYPGMILKTLLGISKPIMNQLAFIDRSARTNIEGDNVGKVEAAKECYQEACSAFILIDGAVWHECREPLLVVDTDAASPHRGEVTIFAGELPEASPIIASGYPRSTSVLFPFNALDRVRAVAAGVSDVGASERRTDLSIDFIDSTAFAHDFPYIQDAIRVLCELVSDGDIPKYLLDQVAEFLADDANWTDETVEQILQDCIANSVVDSPMKRALGPVLDRLNNRPIEFTFETSQLGLPRPRI
jgi:hypothetical protein